MTRYLVTGGAGFIGSHLVEELARAGHEIRVLDDLSAGRIENLPETSAVQLVVGDVRDPDRVRLAAHGAYGIFHLAAIGSVPRSFEDPEATFATNLGGTRSVVDAACELRVRRVVLASSSSVYGASGDEARSESDPVAPLSPYAESKLAAERACLAATAGGATEAVCLRYFNVYGPRQDPSSRYAAVVPRFIGRLLEGAAPQIYGDGLQTRDFTYVADIVAGTIAAMTTPDAAGRVVNLAGGRRHSVNHLLSLIRTIVGVRVDAEHLAPRVGEVRHSAADISVARRILAFAPEWTLFRGVRETVAWHRARVGASA